MSASVELQRTEQWHQDRSGRLTASRFKDVIAWGDRDRHGKRPPLSARTTYMHKLAFERLANRSKHSVSSKSMAWGTEVEQSSHDFYKILTGNNVIKSGFVVHPKAGLFAGRPDW
ncbi:YqaJ viral recombinase family protein [Pseudomonas brassicacearum]|uniref:YqaJ viral recombinase family protein n=1 Tax=Pseudomonas brassicacearum TaxID=930166 RepID=UPI003465BF38